MNQRLRSLGLLQGSVSRAVGATIVALAFVAALILPWITNPFIESLAINAGILGIVTVSWNLMGGFGGLFSFGQAGFFGVGAYGAATLAHHVSSSPALLMLAAGGLAGVACGVLLLVCLRASGIYFAIITLAFAEALQLIAGRIFPGGVNGLFLKPLFGIHSHGPYLYTLGTLVFAVLVTVLVRRSALGMALSALRDDERAAESVGVNTLAAKVGVMLISAGLAGLAGALFAINQTFVSPQSAFDVSYSVLPVLAATLGGIGTIAGPVIGTVAWSTLNELVREGAATSGSSSTLIYGLVLIALAIFLPFGVMGVLKRLRNAAILRSSRRSHPESKSVPAPSRGGRP
jgi:branched-chain amino acid transport system permease protein